MGQRQAALEQHETLGSNCQKHVEFSLDGADGTLSDWLQPKASLDAGASLSRCTTFFRDRTVTPESWALDVVGHLCQQVRRASIVARYYGTRLEPGTRSGCFLGFG
ncbi:hypothetical protein WQE_26240 [Paraburkholderia hospita]|uniref:Uncharacterized protein n=1 Tax=Paraburkholderia hospita TaxID=169430 RepID=A0ABP2PJT4_9BURK|nr:hypothetical protein WQE_26240 [Paraburkholderia hospita]